MKENNKLKIILIVAVLLIGITLGGCTFGSSKDSSGSAASTSAPDLVEVLATDVPMDEEQHSSDSTPEAVAEAAAVPTARAGLESTDPATVNLASGKVQLVEAFAFW